MSFVDIFGLYPILSNILSNLDPISVVCLSRVDRFCYSVVPLQRNIRYDPSRVLSRFVKDVPMFRTAMASTGAVVSGSVALTFFNGEDYGGDLDVYFKNIEGLGDFAQHLIDYEGYNYIPCCQFGQSQIWGDPACTASIHVWASTMRR